MVTRSKVNPGHDGLCLSGTNCVLPNHLCSIQLCVGSMQRRQSNVPERKKASKRGTLTESLANLGAQPWFHPSWFHPSTIPCPTLACKYAQTNAT